jgi:hypothetical protein
MTTKACVICGEDFTPKVSAGKQKTCGKDECRRQRARDREKARKRGEFIEGPRANGALVLKPNQRSGEGMVPTLVAGAIGDVVLHLNKRPVPTLTLPGLGSLVRNVVHGLRSKDRELYEDALRELAAWSLLNLSRVRASAEDRA